MYMYTSIYLPLLSRIYGYHQSALSLYLPTYGILSYLRTYLLTIHRLGSQGAVLGLEVALPKALGGTPALLGVLSGVFPGDNRGNDENRYRIIESEKVLDLFFKQWRGSDDS